MKSKVRRFDLTVYFVVDKCAYSIVDKCFFSFDRMIRYCLDFDTLNNEILFDVYDPIHGQYNINDIVDDYIM